jgi:hypothetical protein
MMVQIKKPTNVTLAEWFTDLNSWFNQKNVHPILFTEAGRVTDGLLFDIRFADHEAARLFTSNFAKYAPSIRCAMGSDHTEAMAGLSFIRSDDVIR